MLIYRVSDPLNLKTYYFCDSQATIDVGQSCGVVGIFSIGTLEEANAKLLEIQKAWLSASQHLFSVNRSISIGEDLAWTACTLTTEAENTDLVYEVFDIIKGRYTQAIGLENAKKVFSDMEQIYLAHYFLDKVTELDTWPKLVSRSISAEV